MLNTVHFDPGQRFLFLAPVSSANTTENRPLLAGKFMIHKGQLFFSIKSMYCAHEYTVCTVHVHNSSGEAFLKLTNVVLYL